MSISSAEDCCERRQATVRSVTGEGPNTSAPTTRTRILFVDDETTLLRVMKMGMRSMAAEWDMQFVESGEEALAQIAQQPFDVVVTDMRMPGINGAQLLNHVLRDHPKTVRIVLSGYAELSEVMKCVGLTHQFLDKPCSLDDLKNCLRRVTNIQTQLSHGKIREFTAGLKNLPSLPELYLEIADAIQSPTATTERIAEIAARDPALSAKLLQLSNSAFFGFSRKVFSVDEAVQLLGVGIIQSLALATPLFSSFDKRKCPKFPIEQIWDHSAQVGILGRRLFNDYLDDSHLAEQAFAAGVLHDIGKIILADSLPEEYSAILAESHATQTPIHVIERKHFDTTHAEVGAYLLAIWGLPIPLVEAVACHHHPHRCLNHELCLSGIVHIANALQHGQSSHSDIVPSLVDLDYLKHVNLDRHYEMWRQDLAAKKS
jgi:HD-like signal output (HDOD) protein/ActR/RegA family two-component response regulator